LQLQRERLAMEKQDAENAAAAQRRTIDLAELKRTDEQRQADYDRNVGLDAANVMDMPGMTNEQKATELQKSVLRNPNAPSAGAMLKMIEGLSRVPDPKFTPPLKLADGTIAQFKVGEIPAGTRFYQAPTAPEKPTYIQVVGPDGTMQVMTPDEIRAQGGVSTSKGTAPERGREALANVAKSFMERMDQLRENINTRTGPQALISGAGRQGMGAVGLDPDVAEYERLRMAGGRALALAVMGAQNLSDEDARSWASLFPDARTDKVTAERLIARVNGLLSQLSGDGGVEGVAFVFNPATGKLEPVKR
jgi:hypothetical protein